MARETIDPGHPGIWPNGEPQSVRDAYDALLAVQREQTTTNANTSNR